MVDIIAIRKRLEPQLTKIPGVVGISADLDTNTLIIYIESKDVIPKVAPLVRGVPVPIEYRVSGRVTI